MSLGFIETANRDLREMSRRKHGSRDTACQQLFVQTVSTAFRGKGDGERTRREKEGRVWYALRAAGSHTIGPKERTPGPPPPSFTSRSSSLPRTRRNCEAKKHRPKRHFSFCIPLFPASLPFPYTLSYCTPARVCARPPDTRARVAGVRNSTNDRM